MDIPKDWFTSESLGVFAAATGVVLVLTNTWRLLTKREWIVVPFVLSLLVVYLGSNAAGTLKDPVDYFIGLANAALLFLTAVGAQEALSSGGGG